MIDALTPRPDRDSASLRLVNLIALLQQEGAHVCFIAADAGLVPGYTPALQAMGVEVWHAPFVKGLPQFLRQHGGRASRGCWCAATTWPMHCCHCCAGTRRRPG